MITNIGAAFMSVICTAIKVRWAGQPKYNVFKYLRM